MPTTRNKLSVGSIQYTQYTDKNNEVNTTNLYSHIRYCIIIKTLTRRTFRHIWTSRHTRYGVSCQAHPVARHLADTAL